MKLTIFFGIIVFIVICLVGILMVNTTQQQFYDFCENKGWNGTYEVTGEMYGEIDCGEMIRELEAQNKQ